MYIFFNHTFKIFFSLFAFYTIIEIKGQRIKESVSLEVDFGKKVKNVKSLSGFLHYDDIRALENDIVELKPKYWRIGWSYKSVSDIDYLRSFNITPILVLSDIYAYPGKKNNKEWPHPLKTDRLKQIITQEYNKFGNKVIYDIWNEPFHQGGFGDFDEQEFYNIFKKAHDIIRALPGGNEALITGPSFDRYDEKEIDRFLNFCNTNNVRVDILSWHEWREQHYLDSFTSDVKKLRTTILPKYQKVGVKKIVLGEIINQYSQFSPSEIIEILRVLENNDIDGACKGCWAESNGVFNCNNSVNGLLDKNHKPRSAWWAYKLYSQSIFNRVAFKSNYSEVSVFPSYDDKGRYILINNNSGNRVLNTRINIKNIPLFKSNSKKININIYEIPNSGEIAVENMKIYKSWKISSKTKNYNFVIENMIPKTLYYITISK